MTKECRDKLLTNPVFGSEEELDAFLLDNSFEERKRGDIGCATLVMITDNTPCEYMVIVKKENKDGSKSQKN